MNEAKKKRRELKHRYANAQKALFVARGAYTPRKAEFIAKREADKIAKATK